MWGEMVEMVDNDHGAVVAGMDDAICADSEESEHEIINEYDKDMSAADAQEESDETTRETGVVVQARTVVLEAWDAVRGSREALDDGMTGGLLGLALVVAAIATYPLLVRPYVLVPSEDTLVQPSGRHAGRLAKGENLPAGSGSREAYVFTTAIFAAVLRLKRSKSLVAAVDSMVTFAQMAIIAACAFSSAHKYLAVLYGVLFLLVFAARMLLHSKRVGLADAHGVEVLNEPMFRRAVRAVRKRTPCADTSLATAAAQTREQEWLVALYAPWVSEWRTVSGVVSRIASPLAVAEEGLDESISALRVRAAELEGMLSAVKEEDKSDVGTKRQKVQSLREARAAVYRQLRDAVSVPRVRIGVLDVDRWGSIAEELNIEVNPAGGIDLPSLCYFDAAGAVTRRLPSVLQPSQERGHAAGAPEDQEEDDEFVINTPNRSKKTPESTSEDSCNKETPYADALGKASAVTARQQQPTGVRAYLHHAAARVSGVRLRHSDALRCIHVMMWSSYAPPILVNGPSFYILCPYRKIFPCFLIV